MSVESYPPAAPFLATEPRENIGRGALLALLTVPAGVAVWVLVWGMGFIASIVGFGVAFLALRLYVWGAGRISRAGALVVLAVTVVTLLLAFFGGIVYDAALGLGQLGGMSTWQAFTHPGFWPTFSTLLPEALPEYLPDFGLASAFGALGAFTTLRSAFAVAEAATPPAFPAPAASGEPGASAPAPAPAAHEPPATEAQGAPGQG